MESGIKLKSEFNEFYSAICLDSEIKGFIDKREKLEGDIRSRLPDLMKERDIIPYESEIRVIDQGSYKYKTAIKSPSPDRDMAVIISLDADKYPDPVPVKECLAEAIKPLIRTVKIKGPCVRATYQQNGEEWIHLDLPLYAKQKDGSLLLGRGRQGQGKGSWEPADPDGLNAYFTGKMVEYPQARRVTRFLKRWRDVSYSDITDDHMLPPSVGLTLLACDAFPLNGCEDDDLRALHAVMERILRAFSYVPALNIVKKLPVAPNTDVFQKMRATIGAMDEFHQRLKDAKGHLGDAIICSSAHDAAKSVRKVLGEDFPVPPKASSSSSVLAAREHDFA